MNQFLLKDANEALLDAFQVCFDSVNDRLMNVSFHFVKSLQNDLALEGALNEISYRNIDKWTQTSSFIDVLNPQSTKIYTPCSPDWKFHSW